MPHHRLHISTWKDIKASVNACNPALYKAINAIPGVDTCKCVHAHYPFGHDIIRDGHPFLPLNPNDDVVDLYNQAVPAPTRHVLDYPWQHYPVALLLSNGVEVYLNLSSHIAPIKLLKPGMLLAIHNILKTNALSLTQHGASFVAGTKSLCMLPKISHQLSHQRLSKAFTLTEVIYPKTLSEQSYLFNHLVHSAKFPRDWYAEVVLFGKELMEKIDADPHAKLVLLNQALQQSNTSADSTFIDLIWSLFSSTLSSNIQHTPMIIETAKHLIKLVMGRIPGFVPATDDSVAPIEALMNTFFNIYRIRYHLPIFMQPAYYDNEHPLYYSLQKPAFLYPFATNNSTHRTINILCAIRETVEAFKEYLNSHQCPIPIENAPLAKMLNSVDIDYFHPQGAEKSTSNLQTDIQAFIDQDPRFMHLANQLNLNKRLVFPVCSSFFNGCVRIRQSRTLKEKPKMKEFLTPLRGLRPT